MPTPDERSLDRRPPAAGPRADFPGSYSIHPLSALDGVLIYVTLNGEAAGLYFGRNEEAAAEALAGGLTGIVADSDKGATA